MVRTVKEWGTDMNNDSRIIKFDWRGDRICCGHISVRVSGQEKEALRFLVTESGQLCDREALMHAVWGSRATQMDVLYLTQLIYRLRKSLKPIGMDGHIVTMPRAGYRFDPDGLHIDFEAADPDAAEPRNADPDSFDVNNRECLSHRSAQDSGCLPLIQAEAGTVTFAGATVYLTRFERALLQTLLDQPDITLGRERLIASVWGDDVSVDTERLTRLVSRLRRSLHPLGLSRRLIYVPDGGYRFSTCDAAGERKSEPICAAGDGVLRAGSAVWIDRCQRGARFAIRLAAVYAGVLRHSVLLWLAVLCGTALLLIVKGWATATPTVEVRSASTTRCTQAYVHDVFARNVETLVATNGAHLSPVAVDGTWRQIVVELRQAGCRSVATSTSGPAH